MTPLDYGMALIIFASAVLVGWLLSYVHDFFQT
jgi:hypothetical protein